MGEPQDDKRLPEVLIRRSPDQPFRDNITAPLREMQTNILASPLTSHWAGKKMAWPFRSTIERAITQNSGEWKREKQFDRHRGTVKPLPCHTTGHAGPRATRKVCR